VANALTATTRPRPDPAANSKRIATVSEPPADIEEDLANELPRRISGLARMLYGASGSALPRGMRSVLFALSAEPLRISQVARLEGIGQSAATRMVARLEAIELVRRERSATDGRVVMVGVTDRGRAELEEMREQSRRVMREVLRDRTARELRQLSEASDALELLTGLIQGRPADQSAALAHSSRTAAASRKTRRAFPS
jgi:DNA-binding MarR family transcriptional regulator